MLERVVGLLCCAISLSAVAVPCPDVEYTCNGEVRTKSNLESFDFFQSEVIGLTFALHEKTAISRLVSLHEDEEEERVTPLIPEILPLERLISSQQLKECIACDKTSNCKPGYDCIQQCCIKKGTSTSLRCADDELRLLQSQGYSCSKIVDVLGCDTSLSHVSPFIPGGIPVYQLCPYSCARCDSLDLITRNPKCQTCTGSGKRHLTCTSEGISFETDCLWSLAECVAEVYDRKHELVAVGEKCSASGYGIISGIRAGTITVIPVDDHVEKVLCIDGSLPEVHCSPRDSKKPTPNSSLVRKSEPPNSLLWNSAVNGERLNGGQGLYNLSQVVDSSPGFINEKVSSAVLGAGMLIRFNIIRTNQIASVAILTPRKQSNAISTTTVLEDQFIRKILLNYTDEDPQNFYSVVVTSNGWAFNVSSSTVVRDFRMMSDGSAISPSAMTAEMFSTANVTIKYLQGSVSGPFPFIGTATEFLIFNKTNQSAVTNSCTLSGDLYCDEINSCLSQENIGKCPASSNRCSGSSFIYCDGKCQNNPTGNRCSEKVVDIWGTLSKVLTAFHCDVKGGINSIDSIPYCIDGSAKRMLEIQLEDQSSSESLVPAQRLSLIIDRNTIISEYNGWRYPQQRVGQLVTSGAIVRMQVKTQSSNKELRLVSLTVFAKKECVDDPGGLFKSQGVNCRAFLPLGCEYDLSEYSNAVLPGTPLKDLCPATCNQCGAGGPSADICKEDGLDICISFLKGAGCPGYLEEWQPTASIDCLSYRFCQRIHEEIANLCNPSNHVPEKPCNIAKQKATDIAITNYIPQCSSDGMSWIAMQSYRDGSKFCVDVHTGNRKPGTTIPADKELSCGAPQDLIDSNYCNSRVCVSANCPIPKCALNECAERGFDSDCCVYRCRELLRPIDLSTIPASNDDRRLYTKSLMRIFYQSGGEPTPAQLKDLHARLVDTVPDLQAERLTLIPLPSALEIDISPSNKYFNGNSVVKEHEVEKKIQQLEIEQYQVIAAIELLFDTNVIHKLYGKPLYKQISREKSIVKVGILNKKRFEYHADFGKIGKVTFEGEEGSSTKINVSLDLTSVSNNQQTVEWAIYPPVGEGCPIPDQRVWDPTGTGENTLCHESDSERWIWCRLGDLSKKHGVLPAGQIGTKDFIRNDWTLPLNGWASVVGMVLVLGLDPPLCATIGPQMKPQLVARFNFSLSGSIEFRQDFEGHDTQVFFAMSFYEIDFEEHVYKIKIYNGRHSTKGCPKLSDTELFNPFNVDVAQEDQCVSGLSTEDPFHCKLGDLTNRYGNYAFKVPSTVSITDQYLDTIGPETALFPRNVSDFRGRHVQVVSMNSGIVIDCANLEVFGVEPVVEVEKKLSDTTGEMMNWVILGLAIILGLVVVCIVVKIALCCSGDPEDKKQETRALTSDAAPDPATTTHMLESPSGGDVQLKAEPVTVADVEVELEMSEISGSDGGTDKIGTPDLNAYIEPEE